MRLIARLRHWFRSVFRRAKVERELADELRFHLEQETRAHQRSGMTSGEARTAALREFGGVAQVQEECRDAWGVRLIDQVRQDLMYAWRGLGRSPGFTAAALLTLVIGIGASTTMFSVVKAVLLRPLPYHEPSRLVAVWSEVPRRGVNQARSGYANIEDWRRSSRTLHGLISYDPGTVLITDSRGEAQRASVVYASANLLEVLGVAPLFGRGFTTEEATRRESLAVLSHQAWQNYFGGDPGVLGRSLIVNGLPAQIIGVMPADFYFPDKTAAMWLPETLWRGWAGARMNRGMDSWRVVARLADGVSLTEARSELSGIGTVLEQAYPEANAGLGIRLVPLSLQFTGRSLRLALFVLIGAVTAVLLIACSNVANLLLARGAARQREFAVREALGAGRARLVGQLLAETTLLALIAAGAGAVLTFIALKGLRAFGPNSIPRLDEISLDGGALTFAIVLSLFSAVVAGLMPALRSTRRHTMEMLRGAGRGLSEDRTARRLRTALVVAEFALAIVLLIAAGLLVRSFVRLASVDAGFEADRVLFVAMTFPPNRPEAETIPFAGRLLERVRTLPGVVAAGISEDVLLGEVNEQAVSLDNTAGQGEVSRVVMSLDAVTPDYFRAVGAPLRLGRFFDERDGSQAPGVVIINETLARRLWPGENPVGKRFRDGGQNSNSPWIMVVGVVADLRRQGLERAPIAQAFRPLTQRPARGMKLVVATSVEPVTLAAAVRAVVGEVDRSVHVAPATTLRQELDRTLAPREFNLGLIGAFAAIALTLAGVGIFGLMNYTVARRTQEIGVRMALGAQPRDVLGMILGDGLKLALAGIALGVGASALLMQGLTGLLYEISSVDPLSFIGAIILLMAIALFACYLPARRALAVSPVTALRAD